MLCLPLKYIYVFKMYVLFIHSGEVNFVEKILHVTIKIQSVIKQHCSFKHLIELIKQIDPIYTHTA